MKPISLLFFYVLVVSSAAASASFVKVVWHAVRLEQGPLINSMLDLAYFLIVAAIALVMGSETMRK